MAIPSWCGFRTVCWTEYKKNFGGVVHFPDFPQLLFAKKYPGKSIAFRGI